MRLFIAINFDEAVKDSVMGVMSRLRDKTTEGRFTSRENLHITLAFLGEIPAKRLQAARQAMSVAAMSPIFELKLEGIGCFKQGGGDIYWMGVDPSHELKSLQSKLSDSLIEQGFELESRRFSPHLTLCRQAILPSGEMEEIAAPETIQKVGHISLMKSERINGRLTHTEIHRVNLLD